MQVVDAATTMGLLFSCMGVGAFVGPVVFNMFTPPKCAYRCDCTWDAIDIRRQVHGWDRGSAGD
jgi:hypothetical protein